MKKIETLISARHDLLTEIREDGVMEVAGCKVYLRVLPIEMEATFLDVAGETNEKGCESFINASALGVSAMIRYMEMKGWCNGEEELNSFFDRVREGFEVQASLTFKEPPPGGIGG